MTQKKIAEEKETLKKQSIAIKQQKGHQQLENLIQNEQNIGKHFDSKNNKRYGPYQKINFSIKKKSIENSPKNLRTFVTT